MNDFDFDKHFSNHEKRVGGVFKAAFVVAILQILFTLAVVGGLIFVGIHFLAKVW